MLPAETLSFQASQQIRSIIDILGKTYSLKRYTLNSKSTETSLNEIMEIIISNENDIFSKVT